jgi:ABC-type transport system involved in multi-copper enzyme maturation permease subunit
MTSLLEPLLGPLAVIECRRSLGRGWVLVVRTLAAVPPAVVMLAVLWLWWFVGQMNPEYSPGPSLVWGVTAVEGMLVTAALLLSPALLAGTLAGDKARSTLGLLLAARVSPGEIVMARLTCRLCVLGVFLAAGLPPLAWLAAMRGLSPWGLIILVALPAAVGFGGGGLAIAVSAVARRGRDALLVVYLLDLLFLLAPLFGTPLSANLGLWIEPLNPYQAIWPLGELEETEPALATIAVWTFLGAAGAACAAWRLRPAYLGDQDGRERQSRPARLPVLGDRPMIWKELYVEQKRAFNRFVKWFIGVIVAVFAGVSILLAGLVAFEPWLQPETNGWALGLLTDWLAGSWLIGWLLQWALGLRAAAAVASERERGTWDLLLTSPLEGREIVWAKIWGSIYVLRGLIVAVVLSWLAGVLCGALPLGVFVQLLSQTIVIGAFMVMIGIAFSFYAKSAARAMTMVIVSWLVSGCVFTVLAGILTLICMFALLMWTIITGDFTPRAAGFTAWPDLLYHGFCLSLYALAAVVVGVYILRRFDGLAGRSACAAVERGGSR